MTRFTVTKVSNGYLIHPEIEVRMGGELYDFSKMAVAKTVDEVARIMRRFEVSKEQIAKAKATLEQHGVTKL